MLQRQTISMPLAQGVDTKTDAKQVVAGKLLQLENGIFTTLKAIRKRNGHEQLGNGITQSSETITAGAGLATYNNELLLANGADLYSYDQANNEWVDKGPFLSVQVAQEPVQHDTFFQFNPDGVTFPNGLQVYAWSEFAYPSPGTQYPTVRYKIIDSVTGQTVVPSTLLSPDGNNAFFPRVIATDTQILIYYADITNGAVQLGIIDPFNPAPIGTVYDVTVISGTGTTQSLNLDQPNFDVCVTGNSIVLAFNNSTTFGVNGGMGVRRFAVSDPTTLVNSTDILERGLPLTVFPLSYGSPTVTNGFAVAYSTYYYVGLNQRFDVKVKIYSEVLGVVNVVTLVSNVPVTSRTATITGIQQDYATEGLYDRIVVYWSGYPSYTYSNPSINATINQAYIYGIGFDSPTVDIASNWATALVIAGRPFKRGINASWLPVMNRSTTQTTFWIVGNETSSIPIAKALMGTAGNGPQPYAWSSAPYAVSFPNPPSVCQVGTAYRIATQEAEATSLINGAVTDAGITALTFEFNDAEHAYQHATLGQNLHFTGGFLQMYDGSRIVEHGFHLYPEFTADPVVTVGAGSMAPGTYQYTACYEWTDAQGNVHRSAPNIVKTQAVVPVGPSTGQVSVKIPYLQLTAKSTAETLAVGNTEVRIVVYRTTADGTIFYRLSDLATPDYNQIGSSPAYLAYDDTQPDSVLSGRPLLYCQFLQETATGIPAELPNDAAPPAELVQLHRNRLWVLDSTNPLNLWYSKEVGLGAPVEFVSSFTKQIDPRGGNVTALASMDDKLLVFKDSHIFYILGQGPTSTGQNNDFSDAILVTTDCGCIEPRSVVGTPFGIMFQSRKGIYLISRSLQVDYVGAPVEAFNSETITSATLVANTNQVRFTLGNGKTLVFDYYVQQWGVFTNQNAVDALIWMGSSVLLKANGRVWKETPGLYTDAGAPIKLRLATSWLSFANVQGFQRVRRAQILGAWKSPHKLKVSVCNDFNDAVTQEVIIDPQAYSAYGDTSPYGEDVYGGGFQLYQWRIDLARQKTQAVKFVIEDISAASSGEGMSLTSLAFEVGAKTGLAKVPPSRIYG